MEATQHALGRLSQIIGLIYEGATDLSRWTRDILPAMAEYIQAPGCVLFTSLHSPADGGYFFQHGLAQEHIDLYLSKYQHDDIWTQAGIRHNVYQEGNVVIADEFLSREELLASRFYKEWVSRDPNMGQLLASIIFGMDSNTAMPAVCSYVRGLHHPAFGNAERQRQQLLLPHISRALGVLQRLRAANLTVATTLAALDRLASGVVLLDAGGCVAFANEHAQEMLDSGQGLSLHVASKRLWAVAPRENAHLAQAVHATLQHRHDATPHFSQSVQVSCPLGRARYTLQFSALGQQNEFGGGDSGYVAIVFITDCADKPQVNPELLQHTYGLSAREACVAIALLEHVSAKEVARTLGVSPNTVRSQIRQIYGKLGVDTRTRFTQRMLGLARSEPDDPTG